MINHQGHRVRVLVGEEKYEIIADGKLSLLQNLIKNGIPVDNLCGGKGVCGKCAVRVVEGSVSPPTEVERHWMNVLGSDMRLSCQVRILSDTVVELKRIARVVEGKILTWGVKREILLRPLVSFQRIRVEPPTLKDQKGDLERLLEASGWKHYDPLGETGHQLESEWRSSLKGMETNVSSIVSTNPITSGSEWRSSLKGMETTAGSPSPPKSY